MTIKTEITGEAAARAWAEADRRDAAEDPRNRSFSVYDHIRAPVEGRNFATLLRLLRDAVKLVWDVAPREFAFAGAVQVIAAVGLAAQLLLARQVLAALVPAHGHTIHVSDVLPLLVPLVATTALVAFATTVQSELTLLIGELVGRRACSDVADVAAAVELDAFERPGFYDRLERAHFNAGNRNLLAVTSLLGLIGALLSAAGVLAALLAIQPLIAPLTVIGVVPAWLIASRNGRRMHEFHSEMTPYDRERRYLLDALAGRDSAKEIRAFDIGALLRRRHDGLFDRRIEVMRRLVSSRLRRALAGDLIGALITVGTLGVLLWFVEQGHMTLAAAGTAVFGVLFLTQRLRASVQFAGKLYEASLFLEDVSGFVKLKPQVEATRPRGRAPDRFERVVVDDVSFTYPGASRPSLRNVSMEIRDGEVVALVGENGSGKTTLAKLLAALHTPTSGRILWDGLDISTCDPDELRRSIAVIFQDFMRWALPARDNIGLGCGERMEDIDAIRDSARRAHADRFLSRLPNGYDTPLSRLFTGGRDLSIGQWQRVALARAFFRDAPFVIMDEPTAALDPLAEYHIFNSVREAFEGRSVLFISHRFSSVRLADRIFVLHDGAVTEHGTHAELMARDGRYARLFTLQASAYLDGQPL